MLLLIFQSDGKTYAIPCTHIEKILPLVEFHNKSIVYGGKKLPVVDWSEWVEGKSFRRALNTRILLISFQGFEFGLVVEGVRATVELTKERELIPSGYRGEKPFFREVFIEGDEYIQIIDDAVLIQEVEKCVQQTNS